MPVILLLKESRTTSMKPLDEDSCFTLSLSLSPPWGLLLCVVSFVHERLLFMSFRHWYPWQVVALHELICQQFSCRAWPYLVRSHTYWKAIADHPSGARIFVGIVWIWIKFYDSGSYTPLDTRLTSACSTTVRDNVANFVWSRYWNRVTEVSSLDAGTAIPFNEGVTGLQSVLGLQCKLRWTIVMRLYGTDVVALVFVAESGGLTWEFCKYPLYWSEAAVTRELVQGGYALRERAMSIWLLPMTLVSLITLLSICLSV